MRKRMAGFCMVLCCGALLAGCAKKEIIKSEQPVPSAAKPAETMPVEKIQPKPVEAAQPVMKDEAADMQGAVRGMEQAAVEAALGKIYFDFDSYALSQAARDTLKKNADYLLKKNAAVKIQIEGNCDERGSDEYNLALGEKRAKAALNYLTTLGVPAGRLSFISYGKEKPEDPGHDEAAWAKNRRDSFVVVK